MGKIKDYSIFFFLLVFTCMSNMSYGSSENIDITLLAIGIHYQGQPDTTCVVKEITDGPIFAERQGQIQSALEMGIANDLTAGTVDKIALKLFIADIGGHTQRGWNMGEADPIDQAIPPNDVNNFIEGSIITLEANSNKKFLLELSNSGDPSVVISDM